MAENQTLKLIPLEGPEEVRVIRLKVAKLSQTLLDFCCDFEEQIAIRLPIGVEILDIIIEFLNYHFDDPIEDIDLYLDENDFQMMSESDRRLLEDLSIQKIFKVLAIADYLQIKGLTMVCKKTIDNQIKDLTKQQLLSKTFTNDN